MASAQSNASATVQASKKRQRSPEKKQQADSTKGVAQPGTPGKPAAKRAKTSTDASGTDKVAKEAKNASPKGGSDDGEGSEDEEGSEEEDSNEEEIVGPKFGGTFDLYGMELDFLNKVYSPSGAKTVNPEALFKEIQKYQAKNDRTAKITIPDGYALGRDGEFRSGVFRDPFEEMPFDIVVSNIKEVDDLSFKSKYAAPKEAWDGPGIKASMEIENGGCGIADSSGTIVMKPLWKKLDAGGKMFELFEGTFTFNVAYSSMYTRKGHGRGQNLTIPFWGIRAPK